MVKHIVFFKLIDNSKEKKEEVKSKLLTLKENIDSLLELEIGINFADEDRAYDIALIAVFKDKNDLNKYATNPYHLEIIKYIKTVASSSKVVDFKY